jgi:integrase
MTALQPLRAGSPETASPVLSYLGRLAPGSRPAMAGALGRVAGILLGLERSPGEPEGAWQLRQRQAALLVPWHLVRREHTLKVREVLAATCRAPATANKILAGLRGVLEEAWLAGLLPGEDYHRAVKLDPVKGRRVGAGRAVSRGDLQAVIGACYADRTAAGARDVALITVLYATGARRSEASALDLDDWDSDERVLRLLRKRNKEQLVPLPDTRGDAIDDWLEVRGSWPGPLFVSARRGGNLTRARLSDRGIMKILEHRWSTTRTRRPQPATTGAATGRSPRPPGRCRCRGSVTIRRPGTPARPRRRLVPRRTILGPYSCGETYPNRTLIRRR